MRIFSESQSFAYYLNTNTIMNSNTGFARRARRISRIATLFTAAGLTTLCYLVLFRAEAPAFALAAVRGDDVSLPGGRTTTRGTGPRGPPPIHSPVAANARSRLGVRSKIALVVDADTSRELLAKNADRVVPIASITKLMTAMVVLDAKLPMGE